MYRNVTPEKSLPPVGPELLTATVEPRVEVTLKVRQLHLIERLANLETGPEHSRNGGILSRVEAETSPDDDALVRAAVRREGGSVVPGQGPAGSYQVRLLLDGKVLGEVAGAVDALKRTEPVDKVGRDDGRRDQGRGAHVDDDEREDRLAFPRQAVRDLLGVDGARGPAADEVWSVRLDAADGSDEDGCHFLDGQVEGSRII